MRYRVYFMENNWEKPIRLKKKFKTKEKAMKRINKICQKFDKNPDWFLVLLEDN